MLLSDFDYHLPNDLIAQVQAVPRDSARLMLINRSTGEIAHHHVYDLPRLLTKDYFIVANNTKVFPARLIGHKPTGGKVEILLTKPLGHSSYLCISKPGLKTGDVIVMRTVLKRNSRLQAEKGSRSTSSATALEKCLQKQSILGGQHERTVLKGTIINSTGYERTIKFNQEESHLRTTLSQIGTMPTPPYIKKLLGNSADYQTIYAKYGFSAAAPTAGLHFTPELLKRIKVDHDWNELTLNVGLGTFLPVKEDRVEDHHMHSESYTISPTTSQNIRLLKDSGHKLLSIGTTTMRALESNATYNPRGYKSLISPGITSGSFSTSIFIYPPHQFALTDALMTNFHLPGSTLLMLVSAFCSTPNSKEKFTTFADSLLGRAYAEAIREKYRFFSFGDAMLII